MYRHIMVPLDGSELAECVLPHLNTVAGLLKGDKKISLVRVVPPLRLYEGIEASLPLEERKRIEADGIRDAKEYLKEVSGRLRLPNATIETEVLFGRVLDELNKFARDNGVDLVIIATHGRSGVSRWVIGSTADHLIRSANIPVLVIRPQACAQP